MVCIDSPRSTIKYRKDPYHLTETTFVGNGK